MFGFWFKLSRLGKYLFHLLALLLLLLLLFFLLSNLFLSYNSRIPVSDETPEKRAEKVKKEKASPRIPDIAEKNQSPPRVAIILDDLGWNYEIAVSLLEIEAPITFSILPNLKYSVKIAQAARKLSRDVLLHLPMGPHSHFKKYPPIAPLTVAMPQNIIEARLEVYLNAVPYIKGVNNHMGSSFTENEEGMKTVLNALKRHGLFFVDSLTTPKSVGYALAKLSGVKSARRSVFLDNDNRPEEIKKRFSELKRVAIRTGSAIGIGHPRRNTVLVLKSMVVELHEAGVQIVPVSQLVK